MSYVTVKLWRRKGWMPAHSYREREAIYTYEDVDVWLAGLCRNVAAESVPTIERLLSRQTRLLKTQEVVELLHMPRRAMYKRRDEEGWPVLVQPGGEYWYFADHITVLSQPVPKVTTYTIGQVDHIFGITRMSAYQLLEEGKLVALPSKGRAPKQITKESVIALLREYLPKGRNPYIWLQARLASKLPMYSPSRIAKIFDMRPEKIQRLAELEQIPSLLIFGHERRIPLEALPRIRALLKRPPTD